MVMRTDVHLRDLRYFLAVAEELHFTRAAERVYVSQPALSKQIRALERQLGVELFRRDRRGVALTAAGTALLPHARRVLEGWEEAATAVERARAARRSTLVVG
ncbi:LysR family transcriptional regulator, partial [Streptomyces sp. 13-12-16]|uniref:LysR family transcriptional regulator n=3 Tax=unclassified Streptomyces TaxID=2593676 RepID=UPI000A253DEA